MLTMKYIEETASRRITPVQKQCPEIRKKKVQDTRNKLRSGKYNPDEHLSIALDRLIEEILKYP